MLGGKIERSALGTIANVGDLYDAKTDRFCGITMLSQAAPPSCLRVTDNDFTDSNLSFTDSYSDKFSKLDVKAELKLSVLGGLFNLEGSGRYLRDEKTSARSVKSTLMYNICTKVEHLNLFHADLKNGISLDALRYPDATHIVVQVSWGANSLLTCEYKNEENRNVREIEGNLGATMKGIAMSISGRGDCSFQEGANNHLENFSLRIFGDVIPNEQELPQNFTEAFELMKKMPKLIQKTNGGKGKPLSYELIPISTLKEHLCIQNLADKVIVRLEEHSILRFVQIFDNILLVKQRINDLHTDLNRHDYCVSDKDLQKVSKLQTDFNISEAKLRSELAKILVDIRAGKLGASRLEDLRVRYESGDFSATKLRMLITKYADILDKIKLANILIKDGVEYIGRAGSVDSTLMSHHGFQVYILHYSRRFAKENPEIWKNNRHLFLTLVKDYIAKEKSNISNATPSSFAFLDCDIASYSDFENPTKIRICLYKKSKLVSSDVAADQDNSSRYCVAKSSENVQLSKKPTKRVHLQIICPGSIDGECSNEICTWLCNKCKSVLEYGFDDFLYCSCGKGRALSFQFKCNDEDHGVAFEIFEEDILKDILSKLRVYKELNILILGETGVGKSTWINGFVNYLTYPSLAEAEGGKPVYLIPASFVMTGDEGEEQVIRMGTPDNNEVNSTGEAATQEPKSYIFLWKGKVVRLIDTPGIGDPRGLPQDKKNFQSIMAHLSFLDEIHGICILLKPNDSRLTVMFSFCIKELLTHLHKDAAKNILFCFTNGRSTFYRPGNTLPLLKKMLKDFKDAEVVISPHTTFVMDNESVRFLAAVQNGINFSDSDRAIYSESWNRSFRETERLITGVEALSPHCTKKTVSLNEARRMILAFTEPLAEISKHILDNIALVEDKKEEIRNSRAHSAELASKMHVPYIDLEPKELPYPRTVCTASSCVELITVDGKTKTNYVKWCHEHCYLKNVTVQTYPCTALKECYAMSHSGGVSCYLCGCSWEYHMHVTYECCQITRQMEDKNVIKMMGDKKTKIKAIEDFIAKLDSRVSQLNEEQRHIINVSANFGSFLKSNAIAPYNDSLREYIELLMRMEKDKIALGGDEDVLRGLEKLLENYLHEVKILDAAMTSDVGSQITLTTMNIENLIKSLYSLPIMGETFKKMVAIINSGKSVSSHFQETTYLPPRTTIKKNVRAPTIGEFFLVKPVRSAYNYFFGGKR